MRTLRKRLAIVLASGAAGVALVLGTSGTAEASNCPYDFKTGKQTICNF
jgi:hypothetical protein